MPFPCLTFRSFRQLLLVPQMLEASSTKTNHHLIAMSFPKEYGICEVFAD